MGKERRLKHNGLKLKKYTRTAERREKNLSEFRNQKAPGVEAPGAETPAERGRKEQREGPTLLKEKEARERDRLKKAAGWTEKEARGRGTP